MLTYVIGFAMYYELFFRSLGFRKSFIGVFIITIATSFSTTGILIVIFLMYMKFYDFVKKNKFNNINDLQNSAIGFQKWK